MFKKSYLFCMVHLITAMSHTHFVRRVLVDPGPCANLLRFAGQKGRSRQSGAVIVSLLSMFARSEAVYDMHVVSLPGKDIDFVPLGAVFLVFGCTCSFYGLGMDCLVMGCSRT